MIALCAVWASPAPAQGPDPTAFLQGVYDRYRTDPAFSSLGPGAGNIYDPALLALVKRAQARAHGDVPSGLDADPVCACQDSGGLTDLRVASTPHGVGATAVAQFRIGTDHLRVTFTMVNTHDGWRIADVSGPGQPSLVAALRRGR